jgi:demethylmenaquinone methyltransferase/2-methoxy-6-polyprenyl-1,4-benzoquinol methylase
MEADCQNLPFGDNSFDTIISAFVLRNFSDLNKCLSEMLRVLDNNGRITVIDLCQPVGFPMKQLFNIYENTIIPTLGKIISKDKKAYTYLPQTMKSVPQGNDMKKILEKAGFKNVEFKRLPFGMCILYEATK